ncbi:hypothetical protein Pint_24836 [Pistacia integerrima]|uniref:Uncharacterized protein n=1 Tax=Pistacia integerrima TaxID=434235 RepID=A0ACC0YE30_9ROSI|nr:hypothetical protein Pint_24836 [Pistacia integerrima]
MFLVGIWFDKIPERTLDWSGNCNDPTQIVFVLNLTLNGQLVLKHSNGTQFFIQNDKSTTLALMQDNGNFVLQDSSTKIIYQSFDNPTTNNILLGQNLVMRKIFTDPGYWYTATTGKGVIEPSLVQFAKAQAWLDMNSKSSSSTGIWGIEFKL